MVLEESGRQEEKYVTERRGGDRWGKKEAGEERYM